MFSIPNIISFLRIPLAFVFLQTNPLYRFFAIAAAMTTDFLDGFLARRSRSASQIGSLLDPIADKFFVLFVLATFLRENRIELWQAGLMLCRDLAVVFYGLYLLVRKRLGQYKVRAIWCGKITTVMQLMVLIALTFEYDLPSNIYSGFLVLGIFSLGELYLADRLRRQWKRDQG